MAQFDESKVINALYTNKAEIGKKYWARDIITSLKEDVEKGTKPIKLEKIRNQDHFPFEAEDHISYALLYPYEKEPLEQRMTNLMLMEWLSR